MKYQSITGTRDVLPDEQPYWRLIEDKIYHITSLFGYQRVDPPILEDTGLFIRGVGETTDIVEKEMYTFQDKSGDSLTLRPEFTAGVIRLYLQNGMHMLTKPVKVFSIGPIFRYERPQAGRFRQHTQFNVEAFGEKDPAIDFEVMSIAWQLYSELGFTGLTFQLNSTGCPQCRPQYIAILQQYYHDHLQTICNDCKRRLDRNALRLLDCKASQCQPIIASAPVISEHLCQDCATHFSQLRHYLDLMERPYFINHKLVRGLDYYTKTVFEVWAKGIGAQNAMCGGGRYDGLIELLGGDPTPGVGFGSGIERMILSMKEQHLTPPPIARPEVMICYLGSAAKDTALKLTYQLRDAQIAAQLTFGDRSLKSQLREANRLHIKYVIIIAEQEIADKTVTIKSLADSAQVAIPQSQVIQYISTQINRNCQR